MSQIILAKRACLPSDTIDEIFTQIPIINEKRIVDGLPPIIDLSIGEPHLSMNVALLRDLTDFVSQSTTFKYSPLPGHPETLAAIAALYQSYYPRAFFSDQEVMITNGATQGIWNALNLLIETDDEVLVFEPHFTSYSNQIKALGGKLIKIPTQENNFKPSGKLLSAALSKHPRAKVLILNYPNNPTGIDLTQQEVAELVEVLQRHPHVSIIIDDVYRELTYAEHLTVLDHEPSLKNRCIVVNSASKGLIGAPGIRAGMIGANAEWIKKMTNIQAMSVCSVSCFTEAMLTIGIKHKLSSSSDYTDWINHYKNEYATNKKYVVRELTHSGFSVVPGEHGFFVLASSHGINQAVPDHLQPLLGFNVIKNDTQLVTYLLQVAGVAVVPGSAFGIDERSGYLRFSCANSLDDLQQAMSNITRAINYLTD